MVLHDPVVAARAEGVQIDLQGKNRVDAVEPAADPCMCRCDIGARNADHRVGFVGCGLDRAGLSLGRSGLCRAVADGFDGDHHRAQGKVAVGNGLGRAGEVGLHAPEAAARPCAGAAEGGDDRVGNQKDAVRAADGFDGGHERGMGRGDVCCAEDRFRDEGGDGAGTLEGDLVFKGLQAKLRKACGVGFVEGVAVSLGGGDVVASGKERFVCGVEVRVAVDRSVAHLGAVSALFQPQELAAPCLASDLVILAGKEGGASVESDPPEVNKARVKPSVAKKSRKVSASSMTSSFEVPRKIE